MRRILPVHMVVVAVGAWLAAAGLADPLWWDEYYSLEFYASEGFLKPFQDYRVANNHVLFTALEALWMGVVGDSESWLPALRLLPMLMFLGAAALLTESLRRLDGRWTALLGGVLFVSAHVTLNFATELRAYGPSWLPVCGGLLALVLLLERETTLRWIALLGCGACATGFLPTNLAAWAVLAAWAGGVWLVRRGPRSPGAWTRAALVAAAPLAGAAFYAGIWDQVVQRAGEIESRWTRGELVADWFTAIGRDVWPLLPAALVGLVVLPAGLRRGRTDVPAAPSSAASRLLLAGAALVLPWACLLVPANTPFPRNAVPALPLVLGGIALLLGACGRACAAALARRRGTPEAGRRPVIAAAVAAAVLLTAWAAWREHTGAGFADRWSTEARPQTLYDQYYHHDFRPAEVLRVAREAAAERPVTVWTDDTDPWALAAVWPDDPRLRLEHPNRRRTAEALSARRRVLLVACADWRLDDMLSLLPPGVPHDVTQVADTGFFKVWQLDAAAGR